MARRIVIDPVTRIEGHAKITLRLGDDGLVDDARFHVTEFRGFEAFCRGRPFHEMPALTARTCGICPVSHVLTGAKAGDMIMAVKPPPAARRMRRAMNLAQILQSHALSFFHLSAPDLLLGFDGDPAERHVFTLMRDQPDIARRGVRLRRYGQQLIEALGGRKIHPAWAVPGGVLTRIDPEGRARALAELPTVLDDVRWSLEQYDAICAAHPDEVAAFGDFPSLFMALVNPGGTWEHHEGDLRWIDTDGNRVGPDKPVRSYDEVIAETADVDTYLKSPYHRGVQGDAPVDVMAAGLYRVGPLARLNLAQTMGTPEADAALEAFRARAGRIATSSFHYHGARLVEMLAALERLGDLLRDPDFDAGPLRGHAGINRLRGVGASEAPRGTLIHDYRVDERGLITGVTMIIATGHNNLAMNRTIKQIARAFVTGPEVPEGVLNRIEAGIRAYDPCLSCSTHAVGAMPIVVRLEDARGQLLHEVARG